ncbi:MAG TPA: GNAT family N-acetyltransferase [Verrucomicrobiae bacterium]|nr:GNAT family N-acetyltransferase [Verrucomicrobiae bacterium]
MPEAPLIVEVAPLQETDWAGVRSIYLEGIATGDATFETAAPEWEKWDESHLAGCRFVARAGEEILGWAALSRVSGRCVYAGVAEVSVYVAAKARGRKVGTRLLRTLIDASERDGIWTLQAGIFPENTASIELHTRAGFRVVGRREKIGRLEGRWRDTLLLERRSEAIHLR